MDTQSGALYVAYLYDKSNSKIDKEQPIFSTVMPF